MTVYVDDVEHAFANMLMCHMWSDSLEELLHMADVIGVQRKWIQGHPTLSFGKHRNASWMHFDIAKSKRALAIKAGATLTDMYEPLVFTGRWTKEFADEVRADDRYRDIRRAMQQERATRWLRK